MASIGYPGTGKRLEKEMNFKFAPFYRLILATIYGVFALFTYIMQKSGQMTNKKD